MFTMPPRVPHNFDPIRHPILKHVTSSVQCCFQQCSLYRLNYAVGPLVWPA